MTNYILRGKILPLGGSRELRFSGNLSVGYGKAATPMTAVLSIKGHQFEVNVSADPNLDLSVVANNTREVVAHVVDALGLLDGHGRTVALHHLENTATGEILPWTGRAERLDEAARTHELTISEILAAAGKAPHVGDALADLRSAVLEPWDTGFYCYRAVESVSQHWNLGLSRDSKSKADAWTAMRTVLRVDRTVPDAMKGWADPQRHGGRLSISSEQQNEFLRATAEVVCRFIKYLVDGEEAIAPLELYQRLDG